MSCQQTVRHSGLKREKESQWHQTFFMNGAILECLLIFMLLGLNEAGMFKSSSMYIWHHAKKGISTQNDGFVLKVIKRGKDPS
jgi:hypothetical protein